MQDHKPLAQRFFFDSFRINLERGVVSFLYSTDGGHSFAHEITHAFPPGTRREDIAPAAFALGMASLVSYWKAILAPEIIVKAGALSPEQASFWENYYTKGLGEFFFVNKIDFRELVHVVSDALAPVISPASALPRDRGALVPFGGGKDSLVTGELLKAQDKPFFWFELEGAPFAKTLQEVSGVTESVTVGRSLDNFAPIMELVKQGAPNGHVPISGIYMMSAALAAQTHGFRDIIMSLERSASIGNVEYLGLMVNHQYSKSFEFEIMAAEYLRAYVAPDLRLFSLVRPLYELQIVREFAKHPEYFPYFISCNKGLKTGTWCGACAKCAFMFAALSAFLPPQILIGIFKRNMLDDTSLLPLYTDMIGRGAMKPFDCVGTFEENLLALYLAGERYTEAGLPLPAILEKLPLAEGKAYEGLLDERGEHRIPADYQAP